MLNHFSCIRLFSTLWTVVHQASFLVSGRGATTSQGGWKRQGTDFLLEGGGSTVLLTPGFQTFQPPELERVKFLLF